MIIENLQIDCRVHGQQKTRRVSIDGGYVHNECIKCVDLFKEMHYRIIDIGGANLPKPKEHEGQYVYGQD